MDDRRFDDLTRRLAHGVSRRTAVKGGVAALLGAFGLRGHTAAMVTQASCGNKSCKNNPGKCPPGCVCCVYGNGNSRCMAPGSCSGGTEVPPSCPAGQTFCSDTGRCAACCGAADCPAATGSCQVAVCQGGVCGTGPGNDGTPCDDGDACTLTDTCQAGVCTGSNPLICFTSDPCRTAICDSAVGCTTTPKPAGTSCADFFRCDGSEVCDGQGNCVDGPPVVCLTGQVCLDGECVCTPASCPAGCCDASGACQPGTENGACGTGGGGCENCTLFGATCGAGGVAGVCGCDSEPVATTCAGRCGQVENNCGVLVDCTAQCAGCCAGAVCQTGTSTEACGVDGANCTPCSGTDAICTAGSCACTPRTCQAGQCGTPSDGCGGTLFCSACPPTTFATPGSHTYSVPDGVARVQIEALGAEGGSGGLGGSATAAFAVVSGQVLQITVGGRGTRGAINGGGDGGFNGGASGASGSNFPSGGGGGATDVRTGAFGLADRILVAGGGGGEGGGFGGALAGGAGGGGGGTGGGAGGENNGGSGGGGGTQSLGGSGGAGDPTSPGSGETGTAGQGGVGQSGQTREDEGGGGGGGGGWFGGGGGGGGNRGGGGGGGSGYGPAGTVFTTGTNVGDGKVVITPL